MPSTSSQALEETEKRRESLRDQVAYILTPNQELRGKPHTWYHLRGWTKGEIDRVTNNPHAHKRLTELERDGLIHRDGTRKCAVTGMSATVWKAGPHPDPKKAERERLMDERERLQARIAAVNQRLKELAPEGQQVLL